MKLQFEKEHGWNALARLRGSDYTELAYMTFGLSGLQAQIEFPSDWHENRRGWVRLGFGLFSLCVSFPWKWVVPDNYQCSGPTYGFQFYSDLLWIRYGKSNGTRNDPSKTFYMPWAWTFREHKVLTEPETHPYTYILKSGEVQTRTATITEETRLWDRWWIPNRQFIRSIDVTFNDEVGERSGSWKGGCMGCSYPMQPGETPIDALRRMERERKF